MSIEADKQKLVPGRRVELFDLDLSKYEPGLVYHFCSAATSGTTAPRKVLVQTLVTGAVGATPAENVNEKQLLTLAPETNTGTFTLAYGGVTSGNIDVFATVADIQTVLDTIVGANKTLCTGAGLRSGGITVEFQGTLAATNVSSLVAVSTNMTSPDSVPLQWRGKTYDPMPITAEGFEISGRGALPTPTIKIANIGLLPSSIIKQFGDPVGAKLTRWVTYSHYLDDGPLADINEHYLPEVWVIERKKVQNRLFVEFELSSSMDQHGRKLPGRQVIRDACVLRYRTPIPGRNSDTDAPESLFTYNTTDMACPWAGHQTFPVEVTTLVEGANNVNEQQRVKISAKVNTGTFKLKWGGATTDAIAFNATAADFQTALTPVIGANNFTLQHTGNNPLQNAGITITFSGAHAETNVLQIVGDSSMVENSAGPYFTKTGDSTSDYTKDQCGKKLADCKARFNLRDSILPFGGFPGVSRIKVE